MPTEIATPIEAREEAASRCDKAYATRDYEAFYAAIEDLSRAAFDMGRAKGKYQPLVNEKPKRKAAPEEPMPGGEWTVGEFPGEMLHAKQGSTIYTVVRPGGDMTQIVAFCDNKENAEMIARALSRMEP